jgi:hypothetical protein
MSDANDNTEDKVDLLQVHCAGARLNPQPSHALPRHLYRDPATHVKFASETGCQRCLYHRAAKSGNYCGKGKRHGKRCEFFRIAKK